MALDSPPGTRSPTSQAQVQRPLPLPPPLPGRLEAEPDRLEEGVEAGKGVGQEGGGSLLVEEVRGG